MAAVKSGGSHPDLAVYRLCKEFSWDPRWLDDRKLELKLLGKTVFTVDIPGLSANVVNRLIVVQAAIDEVTKDMTDPEKAKWLLSLGHLRTWRLNRGS